MKYIARSFIISAALCLMVGTVTVSAHQSHDSVAVYFRQVDSASEPVAAAQPKIDERKVKEPKEPKTPKAPKQPREQKDSTDWTRHLTVKTNVLGAAFLMANAAVEVDIIKNLTFALPVYWSGWDYAGINTLKFRTFIIQPEIRYYIPRLEGFYVGAHFGMGYWNIALGNLSPYLGLDQMDGWRYQDHKGESPAIGGGLGIGYAFQFNKNSHWGMEFALGAGVYDAKYDVFYNEPNGPYHKPGYSSRTTYIGIDNASVSFTYKFGLRRSDNSRKSERKEKEGKR